MPNSLELSLFWYVRSSCCLALPRYAPSKWWECDLWAVTKAGYAREYEIKRSRSDFRADTKKRDNNRYEKVGEVWVNAPGERKHDLLAAGSVRGPSYFWFVVPECLLPQDEVPAWAGIIEFRESRHGGRPILRETRAAPRLHKTKVTAKSIEEARAACYHRYWNELQKFYDHVHSRQPILLP